MRIAIFSDSFYPEIGGIQDSVRLLGTQLAKNGHQVGFWAPSFSRRDCAIGRLPFEELSVHDCIDIHRVASIHIPSSTQQSRFVFPFLRSQRQLRQFAPDVIHTHTFLGLGLDALRASSVLNIPLIGTNHWAVPGFADYFPAWCRTWCVRRAVNYVTWYYNRCDMVSAPTQSVFTEMPALRAPHSVISNPIDTDIFTPMDSDRAAQWQTTFALSDNTIVYAGRFGQEKSIDVLMKAIALVKRHIPNIMLALAGHGSEETTLRALTMQLDLQNNVRFVGTLDPSTLAGLFNASKVFSIASLSETQSMVALQAMACGIPMVAVRSRGLADADEGLFAEPQDIDGMAQHIQWLLEHPSERAQYGKRAHENVQKYSCVSVAKEFEALYEQSQMLRT